MKTAVEINFSANWNGKLDKPIFTTVRWTDTLYKVGKEYGIYLQGNPFGSAILRRITFKRLCDFTDKEIKADTGKTRIEFMRMMRCWYSGKACWQGIYSIVQKLSFVRAKP